MYLGCMTLIGVHIYNFVRLQLSFIEMFIFSGETPMAKASTGVAEIILKSQQKLSLKCLSAQAVKRHGLSFIGTV